MGFFELSVILIALLTAPIQKQHEHLYVAHSPTCPLGATATQLA